MSRCLFLDAPPLVVIAADSSVCLLLRRIRRDHQDCHTLYNISPVWLHSAAIYRSRQLCSSYQCLIPLWYCSALSARRGHSHFMFTGKPCLIFYCWSWYDNDCRAVRSCVVPLAASGFAQSWSCQGWCLIFLWHFYKSADNCWQLTHLNRVHQAGFNWEFELSRSTRYPHCPVQRLIQSQITTKTSTYKVLTKHTVRTILRTVLHWRRRSHIHS